MADTSSQLSAILTDRYRIERQLGQGGMATVYLAEDVKLGREVALKVLRPELGAVLGTERFLAEVKITARLDHPHILTLIDSGSAGGLLYYVLLYVRGESLRDLLNREPQLGIEQALAITKQVGSALDYAHRKGVVHRDIKPENILLQEGEAMLADFGIALAVQESGGSRLTETGLSLGTPHYMSPEQATGDRNVDARSDLYSLASVLYEMLVGEPPMTGKTVQAVIAKLMTEPAMHIRTVRPTVSDQVDAAVAKALAKVPADRFTSVAEFTRALDAAPAHSGAVGAGATGAIPAAKPKSRRALIAAAVVGVAAVGTGAALFANGAFRERDTSAALRDRTQLTFSGKIFAPTVSPDGKQLAFFTKECTGADCRWAIDLQDVGSTTTRRVLEGATAAYGLEWSPDRRNLMMNGTVNGRFGSYVISALGGTPRYLTSGPAAFYAGGDSLLIGAAVATDGAFTVKIAVLDGTVRDSIRVPGPGTQLGALVSVPGTNRIVAMVIQPPHGLWQVFERNGKVTDKLLNSCTCGGVASHDALWMTRAGPTAAEAVVRVGLDSASGTLATHQDTIYSGRFTNLSVTADGSQMTVDDGSFTFGVIAANLSDLLKGTLPNAAPFLQASNRVLGLVSPDGQRLLVRRSVPTPKAGDDIRLSIAPFPGGAETPVNATGRVISARWADSLNVAIYSMTGAGPQLALVDTRTGASSNVMQFADSAAADATPLPNGWAWIPGSRDRVIVQQNGSRREIPLAPWYGALVHVDASADGTRLATLGWNAATNDTLRLDVVPVSGGTPVDWVKSFAEDGAASWLADGSIALTVWSSNDAATLHQVAGPHQDKTLGPLAHVANLVSVSDDLQRATITWREYRGDAWMYSVRRGQTH
jgi:Tol biopolymer transport system component/tRNA A-37 threonylcarbamoyl transferase component Bud32